MLAVAGRGITTHPLNRPIPHHHQQTTGGPAAAIEGVFIANATRTKVISVDYRMPPEHPYPAALDDAVAAWTEVRAYLLSYIPSE